ncbi:hypothetical protein BBP40_010049 [Aspergillus hancockii]|nr:hypothetical protein BBP40_010049 [Aspergillus hancockii]
MTPKPRSKTFTGCWTCRSRRVKCDEQRPHCQKCRRSGRTCQGYGVRLGWTHSTGDSARNVSQRRLLRSSFGTTPYMPSSAVAALLNDLDLKTATQRGPFSVFSASPSESIRDSSHNEQVHRSQEVFAESFNKYLPQEHVLSPSPYPELSSAMHQSTLPDSSDCISNDDTISEVNEITMNQSHIRTNRHPDACILDNTPMANTGITPTAHIRSPLNPTAVATSEIELIHHWVVFLSGNIVLLDGPDNACRTVFIPTALKGLHSSPAEPNMHRAVFHALCAASAFSLFHLRTESRYQSLAVQHEQQALRHLRQDLQPRSRFDEATLVAVLTCIAAEAMSGRRSRWRAHVVGGLSLLESGINGEWLQSPTAVRLLQSYLSLSSLCNLRMSAQLVALLKGLPHMQYYLERSHGVTQSLVQLLADISALRDSPSQKRTANLDQMELQIYLHFPSLDVHERPECNVVQHALNSFYYATVIYFRRTLRRVPVDNVQDLVEKAVQDLEATEALTSEKGGCPYNWASFVVAAECSRSDLQERMLGLFDRKRRHGIRNIQMLSEVVTTLWRRRASAPGIDIHWEEVANEADFDVMLV